ncbi:deoxyribodipyrimidine photo-lyase [Rhodobacteraceae bacterium HSP-20]|uniref:Deoxyribodipyrimidine photo-lyase n=1 Tax=Paragemmobacter amnigenus TaxID=2852097 RepID=A0ABS6J852_9RHOB|nr:FAD-binding domain-containing protein [Rhodobacter amnigenus]MBU9699924.1 deoxyribodipyrimidine photo-lyase [Rhodobacter amnigenus]MBV4391151.1 deoxyribodipyrimidine photo-lyase [Rhodobacter amnigenus]
MNVLVWFKRDLRIEDHPALSRAAALGAVLPVYVVEPELWRQTDASGRQWAFVAETLEGLRADLARLGAPLVVRVGDAVEVLDRLCRQHHVARVFSHEETGNLWTYARDRRVAAWARGAGVPWEELPQQGVVRRLASRDGWARRRDGVMAAAALPAPVALHGVAGVEPGAIPTARALRLADDPCAHRQAGGRARGLALMESFLAVRGEPYRAAMSSPLTGERACSRLSAHLAAGALSGREVVQAAAARAAERPGGRWGGALASFQSRMAWRDHFMQKLEDEPEIEIRALHRAADALRPREPDALRLAAWAAGETGLPFLDACMRYLRATGWLNFRMRSMVMAVASYHLWLDWRATGAVLARRFTDYEPGIHWPQVQMQAGVTGINTIRIYNPVKQGMDQDPAGVFTRRWVPELAAVPDAFLQEPWKWSGARGVLGRLYPEPVVDVAAAARAAREACWGLRRERGYHEQMAEVIERHASRADARFVNDRAPRGRRRADAAQMSLDL